MKTYDTETMKMWLSYDTMKTKSMTVKTVTTMTRHNWEGYADDATLNTGRQRT